MPAAADFRDAGAENVQRFFYMKINPEQNAAARGVHLSSYTI